MSALYAGNFRELTVDVIDAVAGAESMVFNFCGYKIEYLYHMGACDTVGFVDDPISSYRLVGC